MRTRFSWELQTFVPSKRGSRRSKSGGVVKTLRRSNSLSRSIFSPAGSFPWSFLCFFFAGSLTSLVGRKDSQARRHCSIQVLAGVKTAKRIECKQKAPPTLHEARAGRTRKLIIAPANLQKCVGGFLLYINFGGFSRGFSWRIFLGTFSHKKEEKNSGEKIREKNPAAQK